MLIKETNCGATITDGSVKETNGDFAADPEPFPLRTMKTLRAEPTVCPECISAAGKPKRIKIYKKKV